MIYPRTVVLGLSLDIFRVFLLLLYFYTLLNILLQTDHYALSIAYFPICVGADVPQCSLLYTLYSVYYFLSFSAHIHMP